MSHVNLRYVNDVVIVDARGRIGSNGAALKDRIRGLLLDGWMNIVLNLKRVRSINADGINAILACNATAARLGGRIVVTDLTTRLSDLVVIAAIATSFDVYASERDALRGLRGQAPAIGEGESDTSPILGGRSPVPITN